MITLERAVLGIVLVVLFILGVVLAQGIGESVGGGLRELMVR